MSNYQENELCARSSYHRGSPEKGTQCVYISAAQCLDYRDMSDYIRAWPDKLVSFVAEHLCDDDMAAFARRLYRYICRADKDGPAFEEWRKT